MLIPNLIKCSRPFGQLDHFYHFIFDALIPYYHLSKSNSQEQFLMLYEGPFLHLLTELFAINLKIIESLEDIKYYNLHVLTSSNPGYYVLTKEDLEIKNYMIKLLKIKKRSKKYILLINRKPPHPYYYSKECKEKSGGSHIRSITNFNELEKKLKTIYKTELISLNLEDLTFKDQIDYFYNAKMVIAQHGAGLSHLLWCDEQTVCVEIDKKSWRHNCFYRLCYFKNLKHLLFNQLEGNISQIDINNFIKFLQSNNLT